MKTIIDNIQCINGLCGHTEHKINTLWLLAIVALVFYTVKYTRYGINNNRSK